MKRALAVFAAVALGAAARAEGQADSWWAGGSSGNWGDANWYYTIRHGNSTFTEGQTAYFTNSVTSLDLGGVNRRAYFFRSPYATLENPISVTLVNGTLTFVSPISDHDGFTNMTVVAGAGANIVNSHDSSGFQLKSNTGIVLKDGATLTETYSDQSKSKFCVGYNAPSGTSNFVYIAAGSSLYTPRYIQIGASTSATSHPTGVVTVAGANASLDAQEIWLGYVDAKSAIGGYGGLFVTDGATAKSRSTFLMGTDLVEASDIYPGVSELVVSGEGSSLEVGSSEADKHFSVREYGTKKVLVENGGRLTVYGEFRNYAANDHIHAFDVTVRNGGVFEFKNIYFSNNDSTRMDMPGQGKCSFTVDGGTTRALASFTTATANGDGNFHAVTVGPNGWTFDTQNFDVVWKRVINFGTGTFRKIGTGKFEFNWVPKFPGTIDVAEGTLVLGGSETAKFPGTIIVRSGAAFKRSGALSENEADFVLEAGATVQPMQASGAVPTAIMAKSFTLPETGIVTVRLGDSGTETTPFGAHPVLTILGDGVFTQADASKFACLGGGSLDYRFHVSSDAKSILLSVSPAGVCSWTGLGDGTTFSDTANWSGGVKPVAGDAKGILFPAASGALTNDIAGLTPAWIAFGANTAGDISVSGNGFTGLLAVTNLSTTANATFTAPVAFADGKTIEVYHGGTYNNSTGAFSAKGMVIFDGGVTGEETMDNASGAYNIYAGHWTRTSSSAWTFAKSRSGDYRHMIADNSSLSVDSAGYTKELFIRNGGAFTAATITVAIEDGQRFSVRNYGEYVVTNCLTITGNTSKNIYTGYLSGRDVYKFEKIKLDQTSGWTFMLGCNSGVSQGTFFIGKGGIVYGTGNSRIGFGYNGSGDTQTLRPWYSDFTITHGSGNSAEEIHVFRNFVINTDDENGIGRTITLNARMRFNYTPTFTLSGSGTLVLNSIHNNAAQPPVTVKDTATLKFGSTTASLSTAAHTFYGGTTLQLPAAGSGAVALGTSIAVAGEGNVTLKLGEGTETLAPGRYSIFSVTGAIDEGIFSRLVLANPTEGGVGYNFNANTSGTVYLYVGNTPHTTAGYCLWTGLGGDGKFSTAANWQGGRCPQDVGPTASIFFNSVGGEITNDVENLSVAEIYFGKLVPFVKLVGKPISGVSTVSNSGTVNHEIALALSCDSGTPTIPKTTSGYVLFSGGFTAPQFSTASGSFWGKFTMTSSDQWTSANMNIVQSGAELTIPNTVSSWTQILEGGRMNAGTITRNGCERHNQWKSGKKTYNTWWALITDHLSGTVRVGEVKTEDNACAFQAFSRGANGIIIADKLTCASPNAATGSNPWFNLNCGYYSNGTRNYSSGLWAIGPGGLTFGTSNHGNAGYMVEANTTLKSFADWSVDARNNGWAIYGYQNAILTIDTDHYFVGEPQYDDGATVHTVTINGSLQDTLGLKVTGGGKVVFNNDGSGFKNGVTVEDSATFAINAGKKPGTGAVTLTEGSRLEIPQADLGTATVGGALTFNAGTSLVISNLTSGVTPLTVGSLSASQAALVVEGETPLVDGDYTVLSLASGSLAAGVPGNFSLGGSAVAGKNASLSVSGGNLVLTVDGEGAPNADFHVWTGEGGDGLFSTAANWVGAAPVAGDGKALMFNNASGALVNDIPGLTPATITFGAGIGQLSISGEGFSNVGSVVNNSTSVTPVLNTPVAFSGNVTYTTAATMNSSYGITGVTIDFAGGASGSQISLGTNKKYMKGVFDWTSASSGFAASVGSRDRMTVGTNSTVTATAAGCGSTYELFIMPGGSLIVSNKTISSAQRAWCWNMGKFIVLDKYSFTSSGNQYLGYTGNATSYGFSGKNLGSLWANTISIDGTGVIWLGNADASTTYKNTGYDIYVGEGGMQYGASSTGTYATPVYCYARIHPWGSDFTVMAKPNGDYSGFGGDYYTNGDTEFVTTDADGETPRTITMNGVYTQNGSEAGKLTISGNGTYVQNGGSLAGRQKRTAALEVKDTATLKFGNSAAFIGTGPVTMAAGTTLAVPAVAPGVDSVALGSTFTVSGEGKVKLVVGDGSELAAGDYGLFTVSGGIAAEDAVAALALQNSTAGDAEIYVLGGTEVRLSVGGVKQVCTWTGAANDGNKFSTPGNWSPAFVPENGMDIVIPSASGTLVNDITGFAPKSITFGAGIGDVTVSGNAISGVLAITNLSTTANAVFTAPVAYAAGKTIEVYHGARYDNGSVTISSTGMVIFEGGVTGEETMDNASGAHNIYAGHWTRTSSSAWSVAGSRGGDYRHIIYDGSSLTVGSAGYTKELSISDGGAFTAATVTVALADSQRLSCQNRGEYVVTECLTVNGSASKDIYSGWSYANVFKFEKVKLDQTSGYTPYFACQNSASQGTFFIGAGGIEFGTGNSRLGIGRNYDGDSQTIRPWYSDFTITHGTGNSAEEIHAFRDVVFNTDDENGIGRTITLNARLRFNYTPTFTLSGSGTLVVNSVHNNAVQPPVTVTDTATLKFGSTTAALSTGVHTFGAGTTLAVPLVTAESGDSPVSLGSALVLPENGQVKIVLGDGSAIADGHYRVLTVSGTPLPAGLGAKLVLQNPTASPVTFYSNESYTLRLAVGVAPDTHGAKVWNGLAGDGKLSTAANWLGGNLPEAGEDIFIDAPAAGTVVNDLGVAVKSVTFKATSAPVTIAGNDFTGISAVTNLSTAVMTFNVPVTFSGRYCAVKSGEVVFAGGATATYPDPAQRTSSSSDLNRTLTGSFTFTEDWSVPDLGTADKPWIVSSGSEVHGQLLTGTQTNRKRILKIENNASAYFTVMTNGWSRGDIDVNGTLEVAGEVVVKTLSGKDGWSNFGTSGNTGTVKAGKFAKVDSSYVYSRIPNLIVGAGGIGSIVKDWSWRFYSNATVSTGESDFEFLGVYNSSTKSDWGVFLDSGVTLTVNVGEGRTVTMGAGVYGNGGGAVRKTGAGTLVMSNTYNGQSGFTKTYTNGTRVEGGVLKVLANGMPESGTVTFYGGTTLSVPGNAAVALGTTLAKAGEGKVNVLLGDGSALADGDYPVAMVTDSISCDVATSFALANNPLEENVTFYSPDGRTLRVAVGENGYSGPCVWTGETGDGQFSTPGNWAAGRVPSNGASLVFNASAMSGAVNDLGELQIDSITFAPGTAMMGIDGANFTGVKAVTNLSTTVTQTFFNHVAFDGAINVSQQATAADTAVSGTTVRFEGGVSGTSMASNAVKMMYNGYYAIDSWDAPNDGNDKRQHVLANSVVVAGTIGNTHGLNILAGGAVTGAVVNVTPGYNNNRLWAWNAGEFVITGEVIANGVVNNREMVSGWANNSVGKFEKITIDGNASGKYFSLGNHATAATHTFFIGDGGLNFKTSSTLAGYGIGFVSGEKVYLKPWHNGFEVGKKGDAGKFRFRASNNSVLDTDNEAGEGKGIVFNVICESDSATYPVVIAGSGYVRYNAVNTHSGTVTVNSGATLQLGKGAKSGTGALTVKSGATLSAIEPGAAATIGAACTLEDGAILGFKFTSAGDSPKFAFNAAPTLGGDVYFKIETQDNVVPRNRAGKWLVATGVGESFDVLNLKFDDEKAPKPTWVESDPFFVEEGSLYLNVKQPGFVFTIR